MDDNVLVDSLFRRCNTRIAIASVRVIFLEVIAFGDEKYGVVARKAGKKIQKAIKYKPKKQ